MSRLLLLIVIVVIGCQRPPMPVLVDLEAVPLEPEQPVAGVDLRSPAVPALPAESHTLQRLEGAELALSETEERVRESRKLIDENRRQALRSLTAALYRSYERAARAERRQNQRDLEVLAEELWDKAFAGISSGLHDHAANRLPLVSRLALLVGFPPTDPALQPRPENVHDARTYDEAVAAWTKLLAADREFAASAQALLDLVQQELDLRRLEFQVNFGKALNIAAERSKFEAEEAISSRLPEVVGALSQQQDLSILPEPEKTIQLPAVPTLPSQRIEPGFAYESLRRGFLEHQLRIWLAQNGYVLASGQRAIPDRTKEFIAWIRKRRPGL